MVSVPSFAGSSVLPVTDFRESIRSGGVERSFTIAFSMRSGSTVLCNVLEKHGLGHPTECFQYPYGSNRYFDAAAIDRSALDGIRTLVASLALGGTFGSKMSHDHRAHLDGHLARGLEGYRGLDDVLPGHRWIYLHRRDTVAQAVSWEVAEATGQWHLVRDGTPQPPTGVDYDFLSILAKVMMLGAQRANWEAYFARMGIEPLRIVYEDLVAAPGAGFRSVLRYLGVEADPGEIDLERDGGLRPIAAMRAPVYRMLKERFLEDFLELGSGDCAERLGPPLDRWQRFFFSKGWRQD